MRVKFELKKRRGICKFKLQKWPRQLKAELLHPVNACVFCIVLHFGSNYIDIYLNQCKTLQWSWNAMYQRAFYNRGSTTAATILGKQLPGVNSTKLLIDHSPTSIVSEKTLYFNTSQKRCLCVTKAWAFLWSIQFTFVLAALKLLASRSYILAFRGHSNNTRHFFVLPFFWYLPHVTFYFLNQLFLKLIGLELWYELESVFQSQIQLSQR